MTSAQVKFYSDDEDDETSTDAASSEFRVVGRESVVIAIECCEGINNDKIYRLWWLV